MSGCAATEKTVSMVTVSSKPDKTWYIEGECFDAAGMVVTATYSDGSTEEDVGYTVDTTTPLTADDSAVRISFGGKDVWQSVTVDYTGNGPEYSVENVTPLENSPLEGRTYLFLGSSVTYGDAEPGGGATSMVEFIAKRNSCTVIKEAVSGTTLAKVEETAYGKNYTDRLDDYIAAADRAGHLDGFVCQLSTNDTSQVKDFGSITDDGVRDSSAFDLDTTCGAIEYIIASVKETWDCPVAFYTNCRYDNERYPELVELLEEAAEKWDITVIDLYTSEGFNNISDEQRALYLKPDGLHPTKAGYLEWWVPKFEEVLAGL